MRPLSFLVENGACGKRPILLVKGMVLRVARRDEGSSPASKTLMIHYQVKSGYKVCVFPLCVVFPCYIVSQDCGDCAQDSTALRFMAV